MATQMDEMPEAQIRARLAEIKHSMFVAREEGLLLRFEARRALLRAQAAAALAAGKLTQADIDGVRGKFETFKQSIASLKAAGGTSTKEARSTVSAAYRELRDALRSAREKAGVAKPKAAK